MTSIDEDHVIYFLRQKGFFRYLSISKEKIVAWIFANWYKQKAKVMITISPPEEMITAGRARVSAMKEK